MADGESSFEVYGYRTSSRFGSRLNVSVEDKTVTVTGPRVPVIIYRLWIVIQVILLLSVLPVLITALVFWSWIYLVIALALLVVYWLFSSIGAVALWEYQTALAPERGFQTASFPVSAVKRVKIGRGWARNWIWLVILPFVVPINKISEGIVVSFEAPDDETGKDAVYALATSSKEVAQTLAGLLEGK